MTVPLFSGSAFGSGVEPERSPATGDQGGRAFRYKRNLRG